MNTLKPYVFGGWHLSLREWFFDNIFCRFGRHSWKRNQIHKFNGGNTCWLCRNCRLIVRYDSEERTRL